MHSAYEEARGDDGVSAGSGLKALTSEEVLELLNIPKNSLIKISAALWFLNSDMFAFSWRDRDDRQYCKLLPADAVRAAFHPMPFDSSWLPPGTLRFGIDAAGRRWTTVSLPPAHYQLSIIDNDLGLQQAEVPLPHLVFTGCGHHYWVWAAKDEEIAPQTKLYHAPLSNVGNDGSICFGANRPPEADGAHILQAFQLFISSPFNGHLASSKSRRHQGDIRYLLTDLATQEASEFPLEDLLPIAPREHPTQALTLDTLLSRVLHVRR
ncbi:prokaryotic E2 ligase family D protein [Reticulibacter mediterranei]|uniref:prokaryotic E2 ligase family D protein n=1 Tax=Reticulibacter mediterranei TaxID=2778369 RepID=UPI001F33E3B1|nr:prokaryotic E2 ligase family D protein [Reticulibacter mediterranei]